MAPRALRNSVIAGLSALTLAASLAGCASGSGGQSTWRENDELPVPVGAVSDLTGGLNVYGVPKSNVTQLAIDDINANGGVLGRQLELIEYDTKSTNDQAVQYANQLVKQDDVAVVFGGSTSAERDAMRPILSRAKVPYFFNTVYEGGLCDANVVNTGQTASQLVKPLLEYSVENFGKKIYIVGADYTFGRLSGEWVKTYAEELGATVVGEDYVSLDSSDFASTISKIQTEKPDVVMSFLVGAGHLPFYREFAAKGLNANTQIVSSTFGNGGEQDILTPEESQGVVSAVSYYEGLQNPLNEQFTAAYADAYGADHPSIPDLGEAEWNAWHLWAAAVEKAGSFDRDNVLEAIRTGEITADTPIGTVTLDGPTQQVVQDVSIVQVDNGQFVPLQVFEAAQPVYEQEVCDLVKDPTSNTQYQP